MECKIRHMKFLPHGQSLAVLLLFQQVMHAVYTPLKYGRSYITSTLYKTKETELRKRRHAACLTITSGTVPPRRFNKTIIQDTII